jgi:hypothetical protein
MSTFAADDSLVIENFENSDDISKLPLSWRTWAFQRNKANKVYNIKKDLDGNLYLEANDTQLISAQIVKTFEWNDAQLPYLSWRWRAKTLPTGAAEDKKETNDSACGVYVIFERLKEKALKYNWSTTLPVGTTYEKKPGKMYMTVLDSGEEKLGAWQGHKINIVDEYKKFFKSDINKKSLGIGILTDGNATKTNSACDYDDFVLSNK